MLESCIPSTKPIRFSFCVSMLPCWCGERAKGAEGKREATRIVAKIMESGKDAILPPQVLTFRPHSAHIPKSRGSIFGEFRTQSWCVGLCWLAPEIRRGLSRSCDLSSERKEVFGRLGKLRCDFIFGPAFCHHKHPELHLQVFQSTRHNESKRRPHLVPRQGRLPRWKMPFEPQPFTRCSPSASWPSVSCLARINSSILLFSRRSFFTRSCCLR